MRTDSEGRELDCYFGPAGSSSRDQAQQCLNVPTPSEPGEPRGRILFLVGDSHAGVMSRAMNRATAGLMRVVTICKSGTYFLPADLQGDDDNGGDDDDNGDDGDGNSNWWLPTLLEGLKANLLPGDAVAILQAGAINDITFLERTILAQVIRPNEADLILLGDNPVITQPATLCVAAPHLCDFDPRAVVASDEFPDSPTRASAEHVLQEFASQHRDVHFWSQSALWEAGPPGEHLWGNIPGTMERAYFDHNHLLIHVAEAYLWPYLCSFLRDSLRL